MDNSLVTIGFIVMLIFVFCLGPLCAFYLIKKLLKPKHSKVIINISAVVGIAISAFLTFSALTAPIIDSGALAILLLVPLSGLLTVTCLLILFLTNRKREKQKNQ